MSLDPRAVEWMHARIDGVISEKDDAELADLLDADPELRARFEELRQLAERLDRVVPVAPPAELRAGLLAALEPLDRPVAKRPERVRAVLRYAYAVAAGLVLGVLAYHVAANRTLDRVTVDPADIAGAMTIQEADQKPMLAERVELDVPGGSGAVQLLRVDNHFSLTFDIASSATLDAVLGFDGTKIEFHELAQGVGQIEHFDITGNSIRWTQKGHHRVAVRFRLLEEGPASAELQLFRNEERLSGTVLQLPAPE